MAMDVQELVQTYIESELVLDPDRRSLNPDDDLLSEGVIDSMGVLQLVTYIEETFGLAIGDEEIVPENFRTIRALADFVRSKGEKANA